MPSDRTAEVGLHGIAETEAAELRVRRCAHLLTGMFALDATAVVVVDIFWRPAVWALIVGFCLAWLTVVALFLFQEARGAR